jgi:F-type H+-transporting ATPase subunit epsilon
MPVALQIVSPAKELLTRDVDMVVIPGSEGDLAAMEGHAPLITLLRGGVVELHEGGSVTDRFFVSAGFAEITPERCTVLADEATPLAELSRAEGEKRLAAAQKAYDDADKSDITTLLPLQDAILSAQAWVETAQA